MADIEINLCQCCAIVAANGDDSGCRSYYNHPDHALSKSTGYVYVDTEKSSNETFDCEGCGIRIEYGTLFIGYMSS